MKPTPAALSLMLLIFTVAGCGVADRPVREGDPVTVRLSRSAVNAVNILASTPCPLRVSRLIATSAKFGTVGVDLAATVDAANIFLAKPGASVLAFVGDTSILLTASNDWIFQYVGVFGFNCTVGSSLIMSHGVTPPTAIMSANVEVPMGIDTLAGFDLAIGNSSTLPLGTNFSKITLKIPTTNPMGPCTGTYTLKLRDGTPLTAVANSYSMFPGAGFVSPTLSPLPKNMSYIWSIKQTSPAASWDYAFSTDSTDLPTINVSGLTGFCP